MVFGPSCPAVVGVARVQHALDVAFRPAAEGSFQLAVSGPAMANGELVAVPVRFSGTRGDAAMDMAGIDLLTVRDGEIVEVHLFSEDGASEDAFWGSGAV